jgi:hypothetical protein
LIIAAVNFKFLFSNPLPNIQVEQQQWRPFFRAARHHGTAIGTPTVRIAPAKKVLSFGAVDTPKSCHDIFGFVAGSLCGLV